MASTAWSPPIPRHASCETLAANATKNGFPAHYTGALRYYREIGMATPDTPSKAE